MVVKATTSATTDDQADTKPTPTRGRPRKIRIVWLAIAVVAGAASVVAGLVALDDSGLRRAEKTFASGQFEVAKLQVQDYIDGHPHSGRAKTLYAQILVATAKEPEAALAIFEEYEAANATEMAAWARAYLMTGRWSSAVSLLEKVVADAPGDMDSLQDLIAVRLQLRQHRLALPEAERLAAAPGREALGHTLLASIHFNLGSHKESCKHWAKVLEHEPTGENLHIPPNEFFSAYAAALIEVGKPKEAKQMAERSISFLRAPKAFIVLGDALQQIGDESMARLAWRECVTIDMGNEEARNRLASLSLADGKPQDALDWMERIGNRTEVSSESAYLLERCYRVLKNPKMAEKWANRAKDLRLEASFISSLDQAVIDLPNSPTAICYDAWQLAHEENWVRAELVVDQLLREHPDRNSKFADDLVAAIRQKSRQMLPHLRDWAAEINKSKDGSTDRDSE